MQSKSLICSGKKVTENKLKSFDYGFKIFSPVNVKANFNFAIHQSKTFVMILVNTFDVSSLMLVKKQWCWVMLIVCSILFNWRLSKTWVKHYVTTKFSCQAFTILLRVLCSFPCRVWHLNNVRAPLVAISWSQRQVNSVFKSVVDLSFFISPLSSSRFQNE